MGKHNPILSKGGWRPMPDIALNNLPDDLYQQLRQRARAHEKSLRVEIIDCLQIAVRGNQPTAGNPLARARELRKNVKGKLTQTDLATMKNEGRP